MYKELPQPGKKHLPVVPATLRSLRQEDRWSPSVLGQAGQHSKTYLMKYLHRTFKVNKEQYTTCGGGRGTGLSHTSLSAFLIL